MIKRAEGEIFSKKAEKAMKKAIKGVFERNSSALGISHTHELKP